MAADDDIHWKELFHTVYNFVYNTMTWWIVHPYQR